MHVYTIKVEDGTTKDVTVTGQGSLVESRVRFNEGGEIVAKDGKPV